MFGFCCSWVASAVSGSLGVVSVSVNTGVSKLMLSNIGISVNVGMVSVSSVSIVMSKSLGKGNASPEISVIGFAMMLFCVACDCDGAILLKIDVCVCPILWRERMYAGRSSAGMSPGMSGFIFDSSGIKSVVSLPDSVGVGVLVSAGVGNNMLITFFASGISNNGFFVRIIKVVLAIYKGRAAKISRPKT